MDIIVVFHGGLLDGEPLTSDSPDPLVRQKVERMAQILGRYLGDAEKREVDFKPYLLYTVPSPEVKERAEKEGWSEAKIKALMPKYEYEYWKHREEDGFAEISMRYKGEA